MKSISKSGEKGSLPSSGVKVCGWMKEGVMSKVLAFKPGLVTRNVTHCRFQHYSTNVWLHNQNSWHVWLLVCQIGRRKKLKPGYELGTYCTIIQSVKATLTQHILLHDQHTLYMLGCQLFGYEDKSKNNLCNQARTQTRDLPHSLKTCATPNHIWLLNTPSTGVWVNQKDFSFTQSQQVHITSAA